VSKRIIRLKRLLPTRGRRHSRVSRSVCRGKLLRAAERTQQSRCGSADRTFRVSAAARLPSDRDRTVEHQPKPTSTCFWILRCTRCCGRAAWSLARRMCAGTGLGLSRCSWMASVNHNGATNWRRRVTSGVCPARGSGEGRQNGIERALRGGSTTSRDGAIDFQWSDPDGMRWQKSVKVLECWRGISVRVFWPFRWGRRCEGWWDSWIDTRIGVS